MKTVTPEWPSSHIPPMPKLKRRSRITNGKRLFAALRNGNSVFARRVRDLISLLASDVSPDESQLSEAQKMIIRRCAFLAIQMEAMEQSWAEQDGVASDKSLMTYQRLSGALNRLLKTLGIERRAKTVMSLGDLLREDHLRQQQQDNIEADKRRREFEAKQQAQQTIVIEQEPQQ